MFKKQHETQQYGQAPDQQQEKPTRANKLNIGYYVQKCFSSFSSFPTNTAMHYIEGCFI